MFPITGVIYLSFIVAANHLCYHLSKIKNAFLICSIVIMCCFSWQTGRFQYLYRGSTVKIKESLEEHKGIDAILLDYNGKTREINYISQYSYYRTVTKYTLSSEMDVKKITAFKEGEDLMILLSDEEEESYIKKLLEYFPGYKVQKIENVDGQNRMNNYFFHYE